MCVQLLCLIQFFPTALKHAGEYIIWPGTSWGDADWTMSHPGNPEPEVTHARLLRTVRNSTGPPAGLEVSNQQSTPKKILSVQSVDRMKLLWEEFWGTNCTLHQYCCFRLFWHSSPWHFKCFTFVPQHQCRCWLRHLLITYKVVHFKIIYFNRQLNVRYNQTTNSDKDMLNSGSDHW